MDNSLLLQHHDFNIIPDSEIKRFTEIVIDWYTFTVLDESLEIPDISTRLFHDCSVSLALFENYHHDLTFYEYLKQTTIYKDSVFPPKLNSDFLSEHLEYIEEFRHDKRDQHEEYFLDDMILILNQFRMTYSIIGQQLHHKALITVW